ncbi:hypothetical protein Pelo_18484 [Pelomyxa schiedti]|nr:hypothetical protein Pelo_18484 [Pelomyxa schiedti]
MTTTLEPLERGGCGGTAHMVFGIPVQKNLDIVSPSSKMDNYAVHERVVLSRNIIFLWLLEMVQGHRLYPEEPNRRQCLQLNKEEDKEEEDKEEEEEDKEEEEEEEQTITGNLPLDIKHTNNGVIQISGDIQLELDQAGEVATAAHFQGDIQGQNALRSAIKFPTSPSNGIDNYEVADLFLCHLPQKLNCHLSWHLWAAKHGKSEVDGHFGLLSRFYNEETKKTRIDTMEQFIPEMQSAIEKDHLMKNVFILKHLPDNLENNFG